MKKDYTILIDSREKKPLLFPDLLPILTPGSREKTIRLHTHTQELTTADYILSEYPTCGMVERKGSLRELHQNLRTRDKWRYYRAVKRLEKEASHPLFVIEGSLTKLMHPTRHVDKPYLVMDALTRHLLASRIPFVTMNNDTTRSRSLIGEFVARFLLSSAIADKLLT